ncbi:hypothetical protein SAMN05443662_0578 [Sulfurivirga caldicuralii]|uniref:Uncharacterized protein n=1 Tax=Sulfurivirga caldicuralii TaxID=364032 RepID=A0A1N6E429_9GAMM|nr:hypothetical protein SAMN05443662_0578 [Sulfurivirga caldicuralii]
MRSRCRRDGNRNRARVTGFGGFKSNTSNAVKAAIPPATHRGRAILAQCCVAPHWHGMIMPRSLRLGLNQNCHCRDRSEVLRRCLGVFMPLPGTTVGIVPAPRYQSRCLRAISRRVGTSSPASSACSSARRSRAGAERPLHLCAGSPSKASSMPAIRAGRSSSWPTSHA